MPWILSFSVTKDKLDKLDVGGRAPSTRLPLLQRWLAVPPLPDVPQPPPKGSASHTSENLENRILRLARSLHVSVCKEL